VQNNASRSVLQQAMDVGWRRRKEAYKEAHSSLCYKHRMHCYGNSRAIWDHQQIQQAPRQSHTSLLLLSMLHWLPVQQRIDYRVDLLTFKVRSTSTPCCLHRLLQEREDVHNLRRRSATSTLCRPFTIDDNCELSFPMHSTWA